MSNIANLSTSRPLPQSWVNALHEKMLMNFGKKFSDQWAGVNPAKMAEFWSDELAGYTGLELSRGVTAMEKKDWSPSLPEFKRLCRPDVDQANAYYEAVAGVTARSNGEVGTWSHPAIFWAATPLSFDLGNQTYSQIRGRWERALDEQMARGEWEPIPAPMLALPAPGKGALSKEGAAEMMRELGATGVIKAPRDRADHRLWAKKILERVRLGDKNVQMIQIQFANLAMGVEA